MIKCGIPVTQVDIEYFEYLEMPFKEKAMDKIDPYENTHTIMYKYSNPTT